MATEITHEEFKDIINNSHRLVIVDFFAEWCMPCLMLAPFIEELAEKFDKVKFVRINVDDNEELSRRYRISSIPCLVFFKDGKEVNRIIGNQPIENIEEKINEYLD
ncbi:thioredoxin [Candidatus Pacearchaeota archaeon]|nr:thioredoxin [Candidatus Pacearchaeota archaeon]